LGFYLLLFMGSEGPLGRLCHALGFSPPAFTFSGLVIGSLFYSFPFVLHPLRTAFNAIDPLQLEAAATLRAGPVDRLFSVILPLSKTGFLTAAIMGFAHTLGEFGVVLMIGGNIPGRTRVASIAIYDHAESLRFSEAHRVAGVMVILSFLLLLLVHGTGRISGQDSS
jgi:molybdate transport system permease protein